MQPEEKAKEREEKIEDVPIEVNTPEGIEWEDQLQNTTVALAKNKVTVEIQESIVKLAERRAKEEKEKLK